MNWNRICYGCMREKEKDGPCANCGFDLRSYDAGPHVLAPGSILNGKYLVGKVLGEGGFGITYLGWDINLEVKVAIKEFYPSSLVTRVQSQQGGVTVLTGHTRELFERGRSEFEDEAKRLAKFWGQSGIVAVKDHFPENGTAYIVMEFAEGETLREILKKQETPMELAKVRPMLTPVMDSLTLVHQEGILHRDISPDNLMVDRKGRVKLLDFGAARAYMGEQDRSMTVLLKPGYAPPEQYRRRGNQGPWTDVYALSATIYRAITGKVPPESLDRQEALNHGEKDPLQRPTELGVRMSKEQEAVLLKGMAVEIRDRYQSMEEFKTELLNAPDRTPDPVPGPIPPPPKKVAFWKKAAAVAAAGIVIAGAVFGVSRVMGPETWTDENGTRYTGKQVDGKINGEGKAVYADGQIYEGEFADGVRNGQGTCTYANGDVYEGEWLNDQYSGQGTLTWADGAVYVGGWTNNQRSGQGSFTWTSGTVYEGEWKEGSQSGQGTMKWTDGGVYEGEWLNGKKNGQGTYTYAEDDVRMIYEGEWKDDVKNGQGTMKWTNGDVYEGEWSDGQISGRGTCTYTNGDVYIGEWSEGQRSGTGICTYANGEKYIGEWADNLRNGSGCLVYETGCSLKIMWMDDYTTGGGCYYSAEKEPLAYWHKEEDGSISSREFQNDCFYSYNQECTEGVQILGDGTCYIGEYADNAPNGSGTMFYSDGSFDVGIFKNWVCVTGTHIEFEESGFAVKTEIEEAEAETESESSDHKPSDGNGSYTYEDGSVYEGEWLNGQRNGQGTMTYANGEVYEGEWSNDKRNGQGTYTYAEDDSKDRMSYEGEWKDDVKNGQGIIKWKSGGVYEGEWLNDWISGQGTMKWTSGAVYEGEWLNDQLSGQGTMKWTSGAVYEGEWSEGKRNGQGTMTYANGEVYEGEWSNDKMNGQGTMKWTSGNVYEGEWKDDVKNGQGTFTWTSGDVYEGEFADNVRNGQGTMTWANGQVYEGEWSNDKRNGRGTYIWKDGSVYTGGWKDNNREGDAIWRDADGNQEYRYYENDESLETIKIEADGDSAEETAVIRFKHYNGKTGNWTVVYMSGNIYIGTAAENVETEKDINGEGILFYPDHSFDRGTFEGGICVAGTHVSFPDSGFPVETAVQE